MGHDAASCINDPNLRTTVLYDSLNSESYRIAKLGYGSLKQSHSEAQVQTVHFLKKCAILKDGNLDSYDSRQTPFNRGALKFDDFNY